MACTSGAADPGSPTSTTTATSISSSTSTSTTTVGLSAPRPYVPLPGEPAPEVKQLASDALQAMATYDVGGGTPIAAAARLGARGNTAAVDAAAALLLPDAASAIDIVYPQLGGLTNTEASVMVVFRHRLLQGGEERVVTRTGDVRLEGGPTGWSVAAIASLGGDPGPPGPVSPAGRAVLDNDRLDLPDSARWDITAGRIDDRVLDLLARLTVDYTLSVTVLATGHPHNVFASESVSNHTVGRGVDIWAVDGQPVVAQRDPASPLRTLVEQLLREGVTELGSPWDLDGAGRGASFTNTVHQDHLHLAFDG